MYMIVTYSDGLLEVHNHHFKRLGGLSPRPTYFQFLNFVYVRFESVLHHSMWSQM